MVDIVSDTGTYQWYYNSRFVSYNGNYASVDPASKAAMALSIAPRGTEGTVYWNSIDATIASLRAKGIRSPGWPVAAQETLISTTSNNTGFAPVPYMSSDGSQLVDTGATYDTGIVQIYAYFQDWTESRLITLDGMPTGEVEVKVYRSWVWINYAPTTGDSPAIPPIPTPVDITLHLGKQDDVNYFPKPGQEAILEKYRNGVTTIRGKFQGTRIAVIRGNNLGGFILYEEVDGNPSGYCYIYDFDRTLKDVVTPDGLDQYTS